MAHQLQLEKEKYRQWVKAGLGLGYLKEGLTLFCNDIAAQQHNDILQNIRSINSLSNVKCGNCRVETLEPNHKPVGNAGNKVCPLGQVKCSCCCKGKIACPNNICGAIYDFIVQHHASSPPAPNWKNSDAQQWSTDPWSICKCFINAPGYEEKQSAGETDCTGLLHLMINNQYFHSHIGCNVTEANNLFLKVRQYRNNIFHSSGMELEQSEANTYLDDMMAVLQDGKELLHRSDAQIAVKKLQDLKEKDFIITTEGFEDILRQIKEEMAKVLKSTENAATQEEYDNLKKKLIDFETKMSDERKGKLENEKELAELKKTITDLNKKLLELETKMSKVNDENLEKAELKKKLGVLEILLSEQKEEMAKIKAETSSDQSQVDYEQTKLELREKLKEQYHKTLLQVPTTPLQPKSEKCSFNEIYIRPKITREIEREKGETTEVRIKTMSEIFTNEGVPQKSVYVLGDAGSGKTSFCKYLVNCWCLAHSKEHKAENENEDGNGKPEGDSGKHEGDGDKHEGGNENEDDSSKRHRCDGEKYGGVNESEDGSGKPEGDSEKHEGDVEKHGGDGEKHEADNENDDGSGKSEGDSKKPECDSEKHGARKENEDGSGKSEGYSEKHGGDGEKHEADNENDDSSGKHEGDSEKHEGDSEKHDAGNENEDGSGKPEGDSDKTHRAGNENEVGTEEHGVDNAGNETHVGVGEIEDGKERHRGDFEEHEKKGCDIVNEEVNGTHSGDIENKEGSKKHGGVNEKQGGEKHVGGIRIYGSDIQDNSDGLIHSKSHNDDSGDILMAFEKLTYYSEYDSNSYELNFNGVKEMMKFDFVFYIPLRLYQNINTIDEMLQKRYQMKMLNTLLEEESSRVMILLDGLDEWSPENVPEHSIFKEYTIVTTSRPWKFHTLRSSDVVTEHSLNLKGFDFRCEWEMVKRTVSQLNVRRHANKKATDCMQKLEEESLKGLKQVPIMLQQLICLWFDGKLNKTSRCAIYTGMLELFFTWNDMKTTGTSTRLMKGTQKVNLPQYLADKTKLRLNRHFIYEVSQLAYETLFNCPKDKSLTFDICMFDELEISDEVRQNCLKLGIMTEDECPSLSVSEPPSSLFSFIHKSIQEFLAAVNISINFNAKTGSSDSTVNVELAKKFFCKVFRKCSTVNDILEQSNVIIMLCGLEPRLATHVSKYIYETVSEDSRAQKYRRTISSNIDRDHSCFTDIQKLMFDSMDKFNETYSVGNYPVFYIVDLVFDRWGQYCDIICSGIDQQQIVPDSVLSINVDYINTKNFKITKYLPMFNHLEKIAISYDDTSRRLLSTQSDSKQSNKQIIDEINFFVTETIKVNTSTLKYLSLKTGHYAKQYSPVRKTFFSNLPSMINLVAICMSGITMSHDDTTTFCNFLEGTRHLEQIYLKHVECECETQHDVNLSKHRQLQYLYLDHAVSVIDADTTNLEIFRLLDLTDSNYEKIFDMIRKSNKLKELEFHGDCNKSQLCDTNITNRLVTVLPLLHNLSKLELSVCRLTDNIIQSPLEMKSLKYIKLFGVKMSLTTWQKFVDSLPPIPHTVDVSVGHCCITGDGEEFDYCWCTSTAQRERMIYYTVQYVKEKVRLFHIINDNYYCFNFSTRSDKVSM